MAVKIRRTSTTVTVTTGELYFISMAAEALGMHPQTLRKYERLGLVQPTRRMGSVRVYTHDELDRLRTIKYLVEELGINLAGVQRLLSVAEIVDRLRPLAEEAAAERADTGRRLRQELDRLSALLGAVRT
jgi:MerR family transcriptional regulator/heat shock protein HspR